MGDANMSSSRISIAVFLGIAALGIIGPPAIAQGEPKSKTVLVIHGGAGAIPEAEMAKVGLSRQEFELALAESLAAGYRMLRQEGKTSVDAVEAAIRVMEDSPLFNAGRGAVFNEDGRVELDASLMEGKMEGRGDGKRDPRKRAGAVTGVWHVKNPISAARAVMEMDGSRHVLLAGQGAEDFVLSESVRQRYAIERVSNLYFWTDRRLREIREIHEGQAKPKRAALDDASRRFGTVGAVALDRHGNLAAGTSTGGLSNKMVGRIGDSPIIGAGTYADDRACGVSCTGTGELFLRHVVAHDVVARMLYGKRSVAEAARGVIDDLPDEPGGVGGLIALDREGRHVFALSRQCGGMYRGYVTERGEIHVGLYAAENEKRMK
jgi:beta-aspartyl-peptidase (threonine type)